MLTATLLLATTMAAGQAGESKPTAEDYYEFVEYYVGNWKSTGTVDGKPTDAMISIEWSPTKCCQVVKVVEDGEVVRHALWGYDPKIGRWCGLAFNADGSQAYNIHGPECLKAKYGKPFKTRMKKSNADGTSVTGMWTTTLIDEKTYEVKVYEKTGDKRELVLDIHLEKQ